MEYDSRLEINGDDLVVDWLSQEVFGLYTVEALDAIAQLRGTYYYGE